jgi:hypothetical protein
MNNNTNNNEISISSILILFSLIILYYIYINENFTDYESVEGTGENVKDFKIDETPCSKQCCNHVQWPVPFNTKNPNLDKSAESNYIPNNLTCNRGTSGGCVCLTKEQFNYLSNHGQSA